MNGRIAAAWKAIVWVLALGVAGCEDPVGAGSHPSGLSVVTESGSAGPVDLMECTYLALFAIGRWEGDAAYDADVSSASSWESSNPAVAEVGDGISRSGGVILARAPGTARIRAAYLDFSATVIVTVLPIVEQRIVPETTHLAPGSTQTFKFQVRLDPDDPWITAAPQWSVAQADAAATIDATSGAVQALSGPPDVPFLLEATLPNCAVSGVRELRVSPVDRLELEYEQPPEQPLPLGLTALIRVLAWFEDGSAAPQNLSGQVEVDLEDADEDVASYTADNEGIALEGLVAEKGAQLSLRYAPLGITVLSERYSFAEVEQTGLRLDPLGLSLRYPDETQLQAIGNFSDGIERLVTRHVGWTVSDATVASITSGGFDAGLLKVIQDVNHDLTVEAFTTVDGKLASAESEVRITHSD